MRVRACGSVHVASTTTTSTELCGACPLCTPAPAAELHQRAPSRTRTSRRAPRARGRPPGRATGATRSPPAPGASRTPRVARRRLLLPRPGGAPRSQRGGRVLPLRDRRPAVRTFSFAPPSSAATSPAVVIPCHPERHPRASARRSRPRPRMDAALLEASPSKLNASGTTWKSSGAPAGAGLADQRAGDAARDLGAAVGEADRRPVRRLEVDRQRDLLARARDGHRQQHRHPEPPDATGSRGTCRFAKPPPCANSLPSATATDSARKACTATGAGVTRPRSPAMPAARPGQARGSRPLRRPRRCSCPARRAPGPACRRRRGRGRHAGGARVRGRRRAATGGRRLIVARGAGDIRAPGRATGPAGRATRPSRAPRPCAGAAAA